MINDGTNLRNMFTDQYADQTTYNKHGGKDELGLFDIYDDFGKFKDHAARMFGPRNVSENTWSLRI